MAHGYSACAEGSTGSADRGADDGGCLASLRYRDERVLLSVVIRDAGVGGATPLHRDVATSVVDLMG